MNQHRQYTPSRRDDLEQLAYTIIDLAMGYLPWTQHSLNILDKKWDTDVKYICRDLPQVYEDFLEYAQNLHFNTKPKYSKWIRKFKQISEGS